MSTLQGESFYFHHGWHFLRADAFPMAKAVDAHRDAEGTPFTRPATGKPAGSPSRCPTFNDEDLFRDRIQDGGSGQRRTAASIATSSPFRRGTKTTRYCLRLRGCARPATSM